MAKSIKVHPKKRRGRPATGKDPLVSARLPQTLIDQVEDWAATNEASRSEAIRRLVELGLTVKTEERPKSEDTKQRQKTKQRARELAGAVVDEMTDTTASPENQADRKRRLIKGPEEFQGVRRDRPNRK
jgi:Arc/MetJ-type ribon-helix-helix transcriptional regulator